MKLFWNRLILYYWIRIHLHFFLMSINLTKDQFLLTIYQIKNLATASKLQMEILWWSPAIWFYFHQIKMLIIFRVKDGNQTIMKESRKKYKDQFKFKVKWLIFKMMKMTQIKVLRCAKLNTKHKRNTDLKFVRRINKR